MKYKTVEERVTEELSGVWELVARELKMEPEDYRRYLTTTFQAEENAGVQLHWGNISFSDNVLTFNIECDDASINTTFEMPALWHGWGYRTTEGDVRRQRVHGKYTDKYIGEMHDGKFHVALKTPGFGKPGFNNAHHTIYKTVSEAVLKCLAIRLH